LNKPEAVAKQTNQQPQAEKCWRQEGEKDYDDGGDDENGDGIEHQMA
jgi:hypothetical protein